MPRQAPAWRNAGEEDASPILASDLAPGGRIVLAAARRWSWDGSVLSPCLILRHAGVQHPAFAALAALLALLGTAGASAPVFRRPEDPALSVGELGFLAALAALQRGEPWRSQRIIAGWLGPAAALRAIALMAIIAGGLAAAGLRLPAPCITGERQVTLH